MATKTVTMDLGTADVHLPAAVGGARKKTMATKKRGTKTKQANAKPVRRLHVRADLADGGSLHVRHMSDRTVALDGVPVLLADSDDKKPVWIELAKPGVFKGHPSGPFELNGQVFDEILRNFKATENRAIPIDFEHASEADATDGSIPVMGAPAQGWIRELKVEGGRLRGLVEWGDRAREYIRSGQYKFFSPAIRFGARDRVTGATVGARLTSGALTNNPFLDGLKPLAARDTADALGATIEMRAALAHSPNEYMPGIKSALRLHDLSSAQECSDHLDRLRDHLDAAGGDHEAVHEGVKLSDFLTPLRDLVGAQPGATWEDVLNTVDDLIDAALGRTDDETDEPLNDEPIATMREENTTMDPTQKITELSTQLAETKATLSDRETKLSAGEVRLKDSETKTAELTLSLKETTARAETAETELKTLRDWKVQREEKDLTDRVAEAFDTYKDAHKLTEIDRELMLITLKAKPESFDKKYPKVSTDKRGLLRNLTDHRETSMPSTHIDDGQLHGTGVRVDLADAARKLSAQKGIPLVDAQRIVFGGQSKARR